MCIFSEFSIDPHAHAHAAAELDVSPCREEGCIAAWPRARDDEGGTGKPVDRGSELCVTLVVVSPGSADEPRDGSGALDQIGIELQAMLAPAGGRASPAACIATKTTGSETRLRYIQKALKFTFALHTATPAELKKAFINQYLGSSTGGSSPLQGKTITLPIDAAV